MRDKEEEVEEKEERGGGEERKPQRLNDKMQQTLLANKYIINANAKHRMEFIIYSNCYTI